jgi:hypothetical protein
VVKSVDKNEWIGRRETDVESVRHASDILTASGARTVALPYGAPHRLKWDENRINISLDSDENEICKNR